LISAVNIIFELLNFLLIARIILSWIPHNRYHPIIQIVYNFTEPILEPFRNMINPVGGMDLSPIIVFFLLRLLHGYLVNFLLSI
jgi:YggT family protein